jgi:hypothetical protein
MYINSFVVKRHFNLFFFICIAFFLISSDF